MDRKLNFLNQRQKVSNSELLKYADTETHVQGVLHFKHVICVPVGPPEILNINVLNLQ
jgi:hypothetical protein